MATKHTNTTSARKMEEAKKEVSQSKSARTKSTKTAVQNKNSFCDDNVSQIWVELNKKILQGMELERRVAGNK